MILPNCEMDSALLRGEELRMTVETEHIMDGETLLQVTASFGVASLLPTDGAVETVLRTADEALYRAKSNGRNCVVQAEMDATVCNSQ
jgi:diguanylate cyclase (GGDEF)-like protein